MQRGLSWINNHPLSPSGLSRILMRSDLQVLVWPTAFFLALVDLYLYVKGTPFIPRPNVRPYCQAPFFLLWQLVSGTTILLPKYSVFKGE